MGILDRSSCLQVPRLIQIFRREFKGHQRNQQSRDGQQGNFAERPSVDPPSQYPKKAKRVAQPNPPRSNVRSMGVLDHEKDEPSGCHGEKEKRNKTQHESDHLSRGATLTPRPLLHSMLAKYHTGFLKQLKRRLVQGVIQVVNDL